MLETEGDRYRLFTRRAALLGGFQALLVTGLVGRMYYLSVVQGQQYKVLADENRLSLRFIAPMRGRILDRFGEEIASNRQDLRVALVPEQTESIETALDALAKIIPVSEGERQLVLRKAKRQRGFLPIVVRENLSWEEFAAINVESPNLGGVQPAAGTSRYYPDGALFAHVVGHVGAVSEKEQGDDPVLQLPGFKLGKNGIEKTFDEKLRGNVGTRRVEVNARGRIIRDVARHESQTGDDIPLTLHAPLQRFVAQRMGEESAAAVVMDTENGDVLALVSTPAFDPNEFSIGISRDNWNALTGDPRLPLVNKALSGQYPPGSTFKMIVALAALKAGVIRPDETIYCNGKHPYGDNVFHCWKPGGHGKVDLFRSLKDSCDVYYYNMGQRLGIDAIAEMARRFDLGALYDLPIPGQKAGVVPDIAWKRQALGRGWLGGETLNASIGQGYVLTTPVQLAVMTARLATGRAIRPRLIADGTPVFAETLGIPEHHLAMVRAGMNAVVNDPTGSAHGAHLKGDGMSMAGKTGTAQVRRITKAERDIGVVKNADLAWRERDHALFVAFGPVDKPRYALSVIVEHGGGGASVASPIARDIMEAAFRLDPLGLKDKTLASLHDPAQGG